MAQAESFEALTADPNEEGWLICDSCNDGYNVVTCDDCGESWCDDCDTKDGYHKCNIKDAESFWDTVSNCKQELLQCREALSRIEHITEQKDVSDGAIGYIHAVCETVLKDKRPSITNIPHFDAESRFDKLADKIAKEYRKDGDSAEKAKEIGEATAAKIGRAKYGPRRFAEMAHDAESFDSETKMGQYSYETTCGCGTTATWDGGYKNPIEVEQIDWPSPAFDHFEIQLAMKCPNPECDEYHFCHIEEDYISKPKFSAEEMAHDAESFSAEVCPCGCAMVGCVCSSSCKGKCLGAESFSAEKIEGQTQSNIAAKFFVGFDRKGELVGRGKFKNYNSALKKAKIVEKKEGNSRVVSPQGAALWMSDGKGLFQAGKLTAQAKEFYNAEEMADAYLAAEEEYFGAEGHSNWEDAWGEDIEIDSRDLWNPERAAIDEIRGNRALREELEDQGIYVGRHPGYYDDSGQWIELGDYSGYSSPTLPLWAQIGLVIGVVSGISYAARKGWLGK